MAIKDIIVPGFVGTTTIKWLPTRGFNIGVVATQGDIDVRPDTVSASAGGPQTISAKYAGPQTVSASAAGPQRISVKGD